MHNQWQCYLLLHILTLGRVSTIGYITKGVLTPMTPTATTIAVGSTLTAISTDSLTHTGLSITLAATATKIQSGTTSTNLLPDSSTGSIDAPSINTTASVSNNGAIVGDIVGGVVVIGSLLVAIWFLHGQHKRTPEKPPVVEIPQSTSPRPVYHNLNDDWRKKRSRNSEPDELYDGR
ncbi:hypothetical protein PMAA_061160 [Talaromyces marneffei ATCC 18224]|uniref:Uncharacterized protein n=1 Tax=Talaromyces marneffei (strain ATCC 18224 / CBS 334.59 / QM 7333) TaxID=441960 RepID=B6QMW8_TALMQ|nr:hypothetical protein PMAA_061160 [Talaromyces marneffei ATCC 18224]